MRPLNFFSIRKDALWGDESWEISAVEGSESVLYVESPHERERRLFADNDEDKIQFPENKGITLSQLIEQYKDKLVGEKVWNKYGSRFPILVKFINAKDDLSIQVHPNDDISKWIPFKTNYMGFRNFYTAKLDSYGKLFEVVNNFSD